jgi:hypothetical protein
MLALQRGVFQPRGLWTKVPIEEISRAAPPGTRPIIRLAEGQIGPQLFRCEDSRREGRILLPTRSASAYSPFVDSRGLDEPEVESPDPGATESGALVSFNSTQGFVGLPSTFVWLETVLSVRRSSAGKFQSDVALKELYDRLRFQLLQAVIPGLPVKSVAQLSRSGVPTSFLPWPRTLSASKSKRPRVARMANAFTKQIEKFIESSHNPVVFCGFVDELAHDWEKFIRCLAELPTFWPIFEVSSNHYSLLSETEHQALLHTTEPESFLSCFAVIWPSEFLKSPLPFRLECVKRCMAPKAAYKLS